MAPEETHCPPAGGMQPASQYQQPAGLEHSAPKPATSVHGAASQGKLRRLQGLLPLPQTKRTPEKTPQAPPRRKNEMLRSLFGPLLYAADDVVEAYRRPATSPDRGHDAQASPQAGKCNIVRLSSPPQRRNSPQAKLSTLVTQSIPCHWPPSAGSSRGRYGTYLGRCAHGQDAFTSALDKRELLHPARTGGQNYPIWGDTSDWRTCVYAHACVYTCNHVHGE